MDDEPMESSLPKPKGKKKGKNKNKGKKKALKKTTQEEPEESSVYLPGPGTIEDDEELVVDESAYVMLHEATTGDPCLSFDILPNEPGEAKDSFPLSSCLVAGTQSEAGHFNYIVMMRMSNLHKTLKEEKEKEEDEEDSDEDELSDDEDADGGHKKPQLLQTLIRHDGCVNRLKTTSVGDQVLSASWSEQGVVYVYNVTNHLAALRQPGSLEQFDESNSLMSPLYSFTGHQMEGFALAWSKHDHGRLLSGDCNKNIHIWHPTDCSWNVNPQPFVGHTASVEDIQWSPKESNVFMSCSVDKSLRIWDARVCPSKACRLVAEEAHDRDVNVIDWSALEPLIISGGDDGMIKIWDLRKFTTGKPVAMFKHHKAPITSVEWNPHDSSVFVASGADNQISIWDVAVERDDNPDETDEPDVPPQLLFMHLGQKDVKEVHWHPQHAGLIVSTAQSGFNVFRTISV